MGTDRSPIEKTLPRTDSRDQCKSARDLDAYTYDNRLLFLTLMGSFQYDESQICSQCDDTLGKPPEYTVNRRNFATGRTIIITTHTALTSSGACHAIPHAILLPNGFVIFGFQFCLDGGRGGQSPGASRCDL